MRYSLPSRVHVELTSRCNFRCTTCRHGYVEFGNDLSDKCVEIIIRELLPHLSEIELQGTGESLLSTNFFKLFSEAAKYNDLKKILISNASLLTKSMINEFVASNMDFIVSLDGADLNSFRLNRPYGNFDTIIENLNSIGVRKKETNNPYFNFIINMVVTRNNYSCIMNLIELACLINIDYIQISEVRECMPDKSVWKTLRLDNYEERPAFEEYISDCKRFAEQNGIGFYFNEYRHQDIIKKEFAILLGSMYILVVKVMFPFAVSKAFVLEILTINLSPQYGIVIKQIISGMQCYLEIMMIYAEIVVYLGG